MVSEYCAERVGLRSLSSLSRYPSPDPLLLGGADANCADAIARRPVDDSGESRFCTPNPGAVYEPPSCCQRNGGACRCRRNLPNCGYSAEFRQIGRCRCTEAVCYACIATNRD